jgi:outer membrane immunogenic protein
MSIVRKGLWSTAVVALLCVSPALAADLPVKAPPAPPPPAPVFSWNGFYIGANIGGAWTNGSITDNFTGADLGFSNSGFIGGGQAGFNWQINNFVFGIEGDIDGADISHTSSAIGTPIGVLQGRTSTDWIATLTGRVGWTWDR